MTTIEFLELAKTNRYVLFTYFEIPDKIPDRVKKFQPTTKAGWKLIIKQ